MEAVKPNELFIGSIYCRIKLRHWVRCGDDTGLLCKEVVKMARYIDVDKLVEYTDKQIFSVIKVDKGERE